MYQPAGRLPLSFAGLLVLAAACHGRGGAGGAAATEMPRTRATAAVSVDCFDTAGAAPCPPDLKDPSGKKLPRHGGICTLPTCKPCGSNEAPAFRDSEGAPQVGWCMCIPTSDDSGHGTYTCSTKAAWDQRPR